MAEAAEEGYRFAEKKFRRHCKTGGQNSLSAET